MTDGTCALGEVSPFVNLCYLGLKTPQQQAPDWGDECSEAGIGRDERLHVSNQPVSDEARRISLHIAM